MIFMNIKINEDYKAIVAKAKKGPQDIDPVKSLFFYDLTRFNNLPDRI